MSTNSDETDRTDGQIRTIESEVCAEMTIYDEAKVEEGVWIEGAAVEVQR
jgi:hypothetical protein